MIPTSSPATLPADARPWLLLLLDGHWHDLVGFRRAVLRRRADPAVPAYFEKAADKYARSQVTENGGNGKARPFVPIFPGPPAAFHRPAASSRFPRSMSGARHIMTHRRDSCTRGRFFVNTSLRMNSFPSCFKRSSRHHPHRSTGRVLRVCLMNNIAGALWRLSTGRLASASLSERAFEKAARVITPNNVVEELPPPRLCCRPRRHLRGHRLHEALLLDGLLLQGTHGQHRRQRGRLDDLGPVAPHGVWELPRGPGSRAPAPLSRGQERRGRLASGEAHRRGVRRLFDLSSRLGPRLAGHASRDAQRHGRTHDRAEGA